MMFDPTHHPRWLLRRTDQVAVAALIVVALAATAGWWVFHGGWRGRLIEIDRAEPLVARFEVDINAADWPELMQLPGVGPTLRTGSSSRVRPPARSPTMTTCGGCGGSVRRRWSRFAPTCVPWPARATWRTWDGDDHRSVVSTQYSFQHSTRLLVLSTQYSVLSTQYSVLSTQYSVSVLSTQYSVLITRRPTAKLDENVQHTSGLLRADS